MVSQEGLGRFARHAEGLRVLVGLVGASTQRGVAAHAVGDRVVLIDVVLHQAVVRPDTGAQELIELLAGRLAAARQLVGIIAKPGGHVAKWHLRQTEAVFSATFTMERYRSFALSIFSMKALMYQTLISSYFKGLRTVGGFSFNNLDVV